MASATTYLGAVLLSLGALLVVRIIQVHRRLAKLRPATLKGEFMVFDPKLKLPLPEWKWFSHARGYDFRQLFSRWSDAGTDITTQTSIFPVLDVTLCLADLVAFKEVLTRRSIFKRPHEQQALMRTFGYPNIVSADGEMHYRHRKAIMPGFGEHTNELVWTDSSRILGELFETDHWRGKKEVHIKDGLDLSADLSMHFIASCGYGHRLKWNEMDEPLPAGHKMRFGTAIRKVAHGILVKVIVPRWLAFFKPSWHSTLVAYDEIRQYVRELVAEQRASGIEEKDILSMLVAAGDKEENVKGHLTEDEICNNAVVLLIGGHETTAAWLSFILGVLAVDQELQEKLRAHLMSFASEDGSQPAYRDFNKLNYAIAVVMEVLRAYPIALGFAQKSVSDTVLRTSDPRVPEIFVPAGTMLELNHVGIHYNPKYWPNPHEFRPERFLEDDPRTREAFVAFSYGGRMCPGRRFAEVEVVGILFNVLSKYRIDVPSEFDHLRHDKEALRAKVLEHTVSLAMVPKHMPLVFVRRD